MYTPVKPSFTIKKNYDIGMFSWWKAEKTSLNYPHLPPDLALWLTLSGSNYQYLEQNSRKHIKFDRTL